MLIHSIKVGDIVLVSAYVLAILISCGTGMKLVREGRNEGWHHPSTLDQMRKVTGISYVLLLLLIAGAGWLAHVAHAHPLGRPIFWLHVPFAFFAFVFATLIQFRKNPDNTDPRIHRIYVRFYVLCILVTVPTGWFMILNP